MKTIKCLLLFIFLPFTLIFPQTNPLSADKIIGLYWSPQKEAKIEIFKRGNQYFGKTVWVSTSREDTKNAIRGLRKRNLLGIELIAGFYYTNGIYKDGTIYDPGCGKTYDCYIGFIGNDLEVMGYYGLSQMGRREILERIKQVN